MKVTANKRTLEKLGRLWTGKAFKNDDEFQEFADQQGTIYFIARLAIAERELFGDIDMDMETSDEETDRRIDDMFAAARAVCKIMNHRVIAKTSHG